MKCQYVDFNEKKAREEMDKLINGEPASIIKECVTCVACNQYCEKGANPREGIETNLPKHPLHSLFFYVPDPLILERGLKDIPSFLNTGGLIRPEACNPRKGIETRRGWRDIPQPL